MEILQDPIYSTLLLIPPSLSRPLHSMAKILKYLDELGFNMNPEVKGRKLINEEIAESFNAEEVSVPPEKNHFYLVGFELTIND